MPLIPQVPQFFQVRVLRPQTFILTLDLIQLTDLSCRFDAVLTLIPATGHDLDGLFGGHIATVMLLHGYLAARMSPTLDTPAEPE